MEIYKINFLDACEEYIFTMNPSDEIHEIYFDRCNKIQLTNEQLLNCNLIAEEIFCKPINEIHMEKYNYVQAIISIYSPLHYDLNVNCDVQLYCNPCANIFCTKLILDKNSMTVLYNPLVDWGRIITRMVKTSISDFGYANFNSARILDIDDSQKYDQHILRFAFPNVHEVVCQKSKSQNTCKIAQQFLATITKRGLIINTNHICFYEIAEFILPCKYPRIRNYGDLVIIPRKHCKNYYDDIVACIEKHCKNCYREIDTKIVRI
jgi:hypothetical protein